MPVNRAGVGVDELRGAVLVSPSPEGFFAAERTAALAVPCERHGARIGDACTRWPDGWAMLCSARTRGVLDGPPVGIFYRTS
jgi:hypothetical protein